MRDSTDSGLPIVWIGRYQPFHLGHLRMLELSLSQFPEDHILFVTWPPDADLTYRDDPKLALRYSVFTVWERLSMIRLSTAPLQLEHRLQVQSIPLNAEESDREKEFLPPSYIRATTNKDSEDLRKADRWSARSLPVRVMDVSSLGEVLTSSRVRRELLEGADWKHFFPESVHDYFSKIDGPARLLSAAREIKLADDTENGSAVH